MPSASGAKIAFAVGVALAAGTAASRPRPGRLLKGGTPGRRSLLRDRDVGPRRAFEATAQSSTATSTPCSRSEAATSRVRC